MPATHDFSLVFIELGLAIVGLAVLARLASRWGFSAIPLYLIAGLAFGKGGLAPLHVSENFIRIGAEIGVLLLLFMLGLEYSAPELKRNLRMALPAGTLDFVANFTPGLLAGLTLGWKVLPAVFLGGVTWVSSSGVIAKVLGELKRMDNPETGMVLSVLVLEDLAMAVFLPLVGVLLVGGGATRVATSVSLALAIVVLVLFAALRYGQHLSRLTGHQSDEIVLLTTFGLVLLVAGLAQRFQVSAAVAAFLVGIALSGPIAKQSQRLIAPLRDLFAATFFFFFGLEIDPGTLPPVAVLAIGLGVATAATKIATGYFAGKSVGLEPRACLRAGAALIARGEFSIVIAGLGSASEPGLAPLAAAYVLFMAVLGPVAARLVK
jgi:K+:H+ antiporter subunit KhtU